MLMIDQKGLAALTKLRTELAWLKANHPEMTGLIGVAEGHLKTIDMAAGCRGFSVGSNLIDQGIAPGLPMSYVATPSNPDDMTKKIKEEIK